MQAKCRALDAMAAAFPDATKTDTQHAGTQGHNFSVELPHLPHAVDTADNTHTHDNTLRAC